MALSKEHGRPVTWGLLVLGLLALAPAAHAATRAAAWQGTVTHVTDGDTLWVRPHKGDAPRKIRLDGIDAPEICQAYGTASRDRLAAQAQGKLVQVKVRRMDVYGRELAHVLVNGQDLGGLMVQQGQAWSYRYRRDPGPYAQLEAHAQAQRLGLFADAQPERPRDFRIRHGTCHPELSGAAGAAGVAGVAAAGGFAAPLRPKRVTTPRVKKLQTVSDRGGVKPTTHRAVRVTRQAHLAPLHVTPVKHQKSPRKRGAHRAK